MLYLYSLYRFSYFDSFRGMAFSFRWIWFSEGPERGWISSKMGRPKNRYRQYSYFQCFTRRKQDFLLKKDYEERNTMIHVRQTENNYSRLISCVCVHLEEGWENWIVLKINKQTFCTWLVHSEHLIYMSSISSLPRLDGGGQERIRRR